MRQTRPAYNLISNNCQNFAVELLESIAVGAHREFGTSFAVYQRATGEGKITDLWVGDDAPTEETPPKPQRHDTVNLAQQVMDEHTTQLDSHHTLRG